MVSTWFENDKFRIRSLDECAMVNSVLCSIVERAQYESVSHFRGQLKRQEHRIGTVKLIFGVTFTVIPGICWHPSIIAYVAIPPPYTNAALSEQELGRLGAWYVGLKCLLELEMSSDPEPSEWFASLICPMTLSLESHGLSRTDK